MISTGVKGLDDIITGLRKGDNVVWQIDSIRDYKEYVTPFVKKALEDGRKVVYMRFAPHGRLIRKSPRVKEYELDAGGGFESFTTQVNKIITAEGVGAYYVFDCLSSLLSAWASDLMIGNFFSVTCPYLFELDTIAYFSLLRNRHIYKTIARIRETTQLLLDVHRCEKECYIHPLKVWNRYTPTMFLPHIRKEGTFVPITDSADTAELLSHISRKGADDATRNLDYWERLFLRAEDVARSRSKTKLADAMRKNLCRIMVTRDKRIMSLATRHLTLRDLLNVKKRLIGTGLIGGKTVGMLIARKILLEDKPLKWERVSEPHDSYYIGSDVFYTYIVQNGLWMLRMEQKTDEGYFEAARVLREKMLHGAFPDVIMEQFQQMIEYFGTSPIIVRSSSLLEDGYGNAFAGKYESVFLPNQGTPEQRYLQFADAVRHIYASVMSEGALRYRLQRGLDKLDEQMALLVQRVSGSYHKDYFFPDLAGVGISYNTYVWTDKMDEKAGMLRIVFGLGTRAVNRVEGDYPRVVALDAPLLKPYAGMEEERRFAQHNVDLINVRKNSFDTISFLEIINEKLDIDIDRIAIRDDEITRQMEERGVRDREYWVLTFDPLFAKTRLLNMMKKVLKKLEKAYDYPVDVEFTVNFTGDGGFKINILQCRPLQTRGLGKRIEIPRSIPAERTLFDSKGYFLGGNISQPIKRIIYVDPRRYNELSLSGKYDIARIIGDLNKEIRDREKTPTLLLGPGRWGTSTPSLGVPVSFFEINNVVALGEISMSGADLMPDLSFGTHFFQDLVETNIFYVALFCQQDTVVFNDRLLSSMKNILAQDTAKESKYKDVIGVYDTAGRNFRIMSDVLSQKVVCFCK